MWRPGAPDSGSLSRPLRPWAPTRTTTRGGTSVETRTIEGSAPQAGTAPILTHWIGNKSDTTPPARTQDVFNPATGNVIARVAARRRRRGGSRGGRRPRRLPGLARHAAHRPQPDLLRVPRARLAAPRGAGRASSRATTARPSPTRLAEVLRGLETVEFACGLPMPPGGHEHAERVHQGRRPSPCASPSASRPGSRRSTSRSWCRCGSTPSRSCAGNTFILEAVLPHAGRHAAPGGAVEGGRAARRRLQHRLRRP